MTIDITCLEASEYINDSVDGRLDPAAAGPLAAHLGRCGLCSLEHTFAHGAKSALRSQLRPVPIPAALRESVLGSIGGRTEAAQPASLRASRAPGRFSAWRVPLAFAGALGVAVIALLLVTGDDAHNHTRPSDGNMVTESFNNFDKVIAGRLTPEFVSDDPAAVRAFLEDRVRFPIRMPRMREFRLVGARFSATDRETTAHIIYERDGKMVYVSQTDARRLTGGGRRFIPAGALADLSTSGWHFEGNVADCNLAMWLADSTLCTAVADLNREILVANLTGYTVR